MNILLSYFSFFKKPEIVNCLPNYSPVELINKSINLCWSLAGSKHKTPGQTSNRKYENISLAIPLNRFLAKPLRVNKIAMKSFQFFFVVRNRL